MFVCVFVCLCVTARPWVGRTYVFATAHHPYGFFFQIFFFGRRSLGRFFSTTPARERGYLTISGKVFAPFAESEKSSGLSYVALSRLTDWKNLCIGKSIPFDRLTTKIRKCKGLLARINGDNRLRELYYINQIVF